MKIVHYAYVALIASVFSACQGTDKTSRSLEDSSKLDEQADSAERASNAETKNETNETEVGDDAANFMNAAAIGGMMEVELGKAAQEKAASPKVKEFAARMVTDHEKANAELKSLAEKVAILLPTEYPADVKAHLEEMKKLKGAAFDKHYMDMMVKDHVKTLALFKSGASVTEYPVKDFASKTLPILEEHHKMAVDISNQTAKSNP